MKTSLRSFRAGALSLGLLFAGTAVEAATTTVVSLTFGGGMANQLPTLPLLDQYGFKGTYYIITGAMGQPGGYMTAAEVSAVAAAGHEIGSLGVNHLDLTTVSHSTMVYEACASRQTLLDMGISPFSFDYPFGHSDETVESVVQTCGYTSGRRSYGLGCSFSSCLVAESIPPANPYFIRTVPVVTSTTALGEIQQHIVNAENSGGGWVPLAFINVCDGCDEYSITREDLSSLLSWLADRASRGTVVRNVGQVITGSGGSSPPPPDSNVGLAADLSRSRVFPNPWRVDRHAAAGVTIDGLPPRSEIRIYTLSGRWVKTVDASPAGQGTWGLTDDSGRSVASGIYQYLISAPGLPRKRGSLTVVR